MTDALLFIIAVTLALFVFAWCVDRLATLDAAKLHRPLSRIALTIGAVVTAPVALGTLIAGLFTALALFRGFAR